MGVLSAFRGGGKCFQKCRQCKRMSKIFFLGSHFDELVLLVIDFVVVDFFEKIVSEGFINGELHVTDGVGWLMLEPK